MYIFVCNLVNLNIYLYIHIYIYTLYVFYKYIYLYIHTYTTLIAMGPYALGRCTRTHFGFLLAPVPYRYCMSAVDVFHMIC